MGLIVGLDFLRRNQCTIDVVSNQLHLDKGRLSTPFLSESDLPMHAKTTVPNMSAEDEELHDLEDMVEVLTEDNKLKLRNLTKVGKCSEDTAREALRKHSWDLSAAMLEVLTETMAGSMTQLTVRQKRERLFRNQRAK